MKATYDQVRQWTDRDLIDVNGEKIGTIDDLYYDEDTGQPEWLLVRTGLFGTKKTFVPASAARISGDDVFVSFEKDRVKDAPRIDEDELTDSQERELYRHYGMDYDASLNYGRSAPTRAAAGTGRYAEQGGRDTAMTRSEEELDLRTVRRPRELVRLRKVIVTEPVTRTVPVQHEEIRVEREPITDRNRDAAMRGPALREGEHTEVLSEEEVVAEKRVEPKERVRLDKDVVTEEETVEEELRKERIEVERERKDRGR